MYTIVTIDDDVAVRRLLASALSAEHIECVQAGNLADGFKLCESGKPDMILLDVTLPDGDGIELCRKIKSNVKLRHIPVLIMTGEATAADFRISGMEAGADDYVLKPFSVKELMGRIKVILHRSTRPSAS